MLVDQLKHRICIKQQAIMDQHELIVYVILVRLVALVHLPPQLCEVLLHELNVLTAEPLLESLVKRLHIADGYLLHVLHILLGHLLVLRQ